MKECHPFEHFKTKLDIERRSQDERREAMPAEPSLWHHVVAVKSHQNTKRKNGCRACGKAWIVLHLCLNWISFMLIKFNPEVLTAAKFKDSSPSKWKWISKRWASFYTSKLPVFLWWTGGLLGSISAACSMPAGIDWLNMCRWMTVFPAIRSDNETANELALNTSEIEFAHGFKLFAKICSKWFRQWTC